MFLLACGIFACGLCSLGSDLLCTQRANLFQASSLTSQATQIVELFAAYFCVTQHFDLLDARRVDQKCTFDTDTIGDTADGEIAVYTAAAQTNDDTFKWLKAL